MVKPNPLKIKCTVLESMAILFSHYKGIENLKWYGSCFEFNLTHLNFDNPLEQLCLSIPQKVRPNIGLSIEYTRFDTGNPNNPKRRVKLIYHERK